MLKPAPVFVEFSLSSLLLVVGWPFEREKLNVSLSCLYAEGPLEKE